MWREAAIVEVHETVGANGKKKKVRKRVGGSGLWHQVPAFWTAPTAARQSAEPPEAASTRPRNIRNTWHLPGLTPLYYAGLCRSLLS